MKRYVVIDYVKTEVKNSYITFKETKEVQIEADSLGEAKELLLMTDSKDAYILDKASKKHIKKEDL